MKYTISDTITEFRSYEVEANTYEEAAALVEQHATDNPNDDIHPNITFLDRGITDRFQQMEQPND
jgi:hypothetical protein